MTAVIMPSLSLGRLDGALTSFARAPRQRIGSAAMFAAPGGSTPAGHPGARHQPFG
jgi:hypothetical protein